MMQMPERERSDQKSTVISGMSSFLALQSLRPSVCCENFTLLLAGSRGTSGEGEQPSASCCRIDFDGKPSPAAAASNPPRGRVSKPRGLPNALCFDSEAA